MDQIGPELVGDDGADILKLDIDDCGVAMVTINRPERRNALTLDLWRRLGRLFQNLGTDDQVRVIILTGSHGSFCSGADIGEFASVRSDAAQALLYERAYEGCCDTIEMTPKPTIAAVNGFCFGGGCNIAMSCDFRYAVPAAQFAIPAARLSIVYGLGGTRRLFSLVGLSNAKHIMFSAQRINAERALRIGLIDEIAEDIYESAVEFARVIAKNAPLTISGSKTILNSLSKGPVDIENIRHLITQAAESEDYREGRAAFTEKRAPHFRGQ